MIHTCDDALHPPSIPPIETVRPFLGDSEALEIGRVAEGREDVRRGAPREERAEGGRVHAVGGGVSVREGDGERR
jgi:hypothetical protein